MKNRVMPTFNSFEWLEKVKKMIKQRGIGFHIFVFLIVSIYFIYSFKNISYDYNESSVVYIDQDLSKFGFLHSSGRESVSIVFGNL